MSESKNHEKKFAMAYDPNEAAPHRFNGPFDERSGVFMSISVPNGATVVNRIKLSRFGHRPRSGIRKAVSRDPKAEV
jgi:hypothetical protein